MLVLLVKALVEATELAEPDPPSEQMTPWRWSALVADWPVALGGAVEEVALLLGAPPEAQRRLQAVRSHPMVRWRG